MSRVDRCGRRIGHFSDSLRASALALTVGVLVSTRALAANDPSAPIPIPMPAPARSMSLAEALTYARANQPSLQSARARVAAAAADTRIPRAQWLPGFGLTLQAFEGTANNSTASYIGVRGVDIPRIGGTALHATGTFSPSTSTLGAIGGSQEIFDFGRIAAETAVTDVAYEAERHHADAERLRIDLLVRDAFYAVEGAHAVQRAAEEAYARARGHRDMAAAEVKSGLHAPIELTRAEADLTRFDVARIRAAGSLATAQAVFAAAVGVADPTLEAVGEAPATAPLPPLDQSLKTSLERDPLLLEARTRVRGAEAVTRALAAQLRPDLSLTATLSGRGSSAEPNAGPLSPDYGPAPVIANWDLGLVLRWPLYDPVTAARRDAAATRADLARADVSVLAQQETAAVQQAYVAVHVARAALVGLERAVDAARANYAQAEARFKAGLGTSLELADAEAVRTDVEIQLAIGRYDALRARAVLTRLLAEDA